MGYSRRISNYPKRILPFDLTYIMSMANLVAISVESPRTKIVGAIWKKEFIELIYINP